MLHTTGSSGAAVVPAQVTSSPAQITLAPAQVISSPAGESVGATFAYLAARASGAVPAQIAPNPNADPGNPHAADARTAQPPAFGAPASQAPPAFSAPPAAAPAASPPNASPAAAAPAPAAANPAATTASVIYTPNGPIYPGGASAPSSTSAANQPASANAASAVNPTTAGANARGPSAIAAPPTNTGAPGTAAGPAPRTNSTSGSVALTSVGGGSSSSSRITPNLPGTPSGLRIVNTAQSQLGAPYTWAGVSLPRTMPEQMAAGRRISLDQVRPGDVLFFADTYTPGLSHNGIYAGDGKFIHAADESTGVVLTPLASAYWWERFVAAVRLID